MRRVLIVEDEALVALEIEEALTDAGFAVAGVFGSTEDALGFLKDGSADVAVLDANLRGRSVAPVAERLGELRIPFVAISGYSADQLGPWLGGAPLLGKPFDEERLVAEVARAARAGSG
ncbi:MAG: response regulator [Alphaproteobacteria bacterium]|nr:response regulator [Alphaproteobacteria bacterium]